MNGTINLNNFLQPEEAPVSIKSGLQKDAYTFQAENDANIINNYNLRNFSFNKGIGGTLILGGTVISGSAGVNGMMELKDESGSIIFTGDSEGHHYYNTSGIESIRVDLSGFHAYGTPGTSQELVKVDNTGLHGYLSNGFESLNVGPTGINGYGTAGNTYEFYNTLGGTLYGKIGYNTSAAGTPWFSFIGQNGAAFVIADEHGTIGIVSGGMLIQSDDFMAVTAEAGIIISPDGTAAGTTPLIVNGDFEVTGAKSALVETSKGNRLLYANESPENWFMDFCESKERVDPMFLEVTSPPYHFIKCDGVGYQVWGKRKGYESKRFEERTKLLTKLKKGLDNQNKELK